MENPNECGMTAVLHLRGAGPLSVQVYDLTGANSDADERYSVSIGAGVRIQEVVLFLSPGHLVQLSSALECWARAIQSRDLPEPMVGAVDPQQDDELVDVRGDK